MKKLIKDFIKNFKNYINYLMSVNFKDLFINTVIILCIVILSGIVYVPIGIVEDLIRSFISIFGLMPEKVAVIYNWIFDFISALSLAVFFMFLFNKRFEDIESLKKQMDDKSDYNKKSVEKKTKKEEKEDDLLDLPKTREK